MLSKRFSVIAILTVAALVLAACPVPEAPVAPPPEPEVVEPAPPEKVTIRMTTWAGEGESAELQELVLDRLNAAQDEFEIIHEPAPADYYTKIQTALAGGVGADLMWLSQEHIAGFASRGALLDVTQCMEASDEPAAQLDLYFADVLKTNYYEGRLYGLPWISQPVVLYYNPEMFDEAGLPYPDETWDWDTFYETAVALTQDLTGDGTPDQYGFTLTGWPPPQMFIWQAGGEVITADLQSSPIDTPEAIAGAEFYQRMIYNEECCPSQETIAERGFSEMFRAGEVAMFMGGAADTFDGLDVVGASVVPMGPANQATFSWTAGTVVNADTENPEIACKALIALTEGIHHWKIVPPRSDLATAEQILANIPEQWQAQKEGQLDALVASTPNMRAFNVVPRHQEWDDIFWREYMDPLFQRQATPEELAPEVRPLLEEVSPR